MLSDLIYRFRALFQRQRADSDLEDELRFHLELETEKHVARGLPRDEAARRARLDFGGNVEHTEACRDARGVALFETAWKDVRYAVRTLRASPLFAGTVIVSLALGIGANTAVFTLLRASLWKPLPVAKADEIFQVQQLKPGEGARADGGFSYVLFEQLGKAAEPYGEIAGKSGFGLRKFGTDAESRERVVAEAVTANFFSVLQVRPVAGRLFERADDNVLGGERVAVLSHRFWRSRFRSNPAVAGQRVFLNEVPYTVVGVADRGFDGVEAEALVDMWVPVTADVPQQWLVSPHFNWLRLMGRLRPEAEAALDSRFRAHLTQELLPGLSAHFRAKLEAMHVRLRPASAGLSTTGRRYATPLLILLAVAGFVLLICCANVANLVIARNRFKANEIAVRRALGASRGRIAGQLFIEVLLLALAGVLLGIVLAPWSCRALLSLLPASRVPLAFDFHPDWAVLGFTIAIGVATAALSGLVPALRASREGAGLGLRSGSRVTGRTLAGRALVAGQLALCLVLLIGAGLFLDSLRRLKGIDLGFRPEQVVTFDVSFPKSTPNDRVLRTYEQIRQRLASSPGVAAASYATPGVYGDGGWSMGVKPEGYAAGPAEDIEAGIIAGGPDFFETIRLGLVEGRYLAARDTVDSPPVAVVNESFCRKYFGGSRQALGRRIRIPGRTVVMREIVGVVRDARHYGAREMPWRMVYLPASRDGSLLVRAAGDPRSLNAAIREAVSGSDAQVEQIRLLEDDVNGMVSRERLVAALSGVFAALAVFLASVGLYGVLAYNVSRRTSELGIRMALGAQRRHAQWLVLRETLEVLAVGSVAGFIGALGLTRLVTSVLYGVQATDSGIFAVSGAILAGVAGLAAFLPARRASRIDPMVALRYE